MTTRESIQQTTMPPNAQNTKLEHAPDTNLAQSSLHLNDTLKTLLQEKYEIEQLIGKGAQSHVYRGKRLLDNMPVAIKQLRVNSAKNWKQYELFEREAEVLKNLNVSGTAKFYEAIKSLDGENPTSVIVQEYIDGRSLQSYIDQQTRFPYPNTD